MSGGGDVPSMGSVMGGNSGSGGRSGEAGAAGSTPFAQAAGFGGSGSSSHGGGFSKVAKLATATASELAKGVGSQMKQGFQERVNETAGGKMAAVIRESMEPNETGQSGQFDGNSLGGSQGNGEASPFVNRDTDTNQYRS